MWKFYTEEKIKTLATEVCYRDLNPSLNELWTSSLVNHEQG